MTVEQAMRNIFQLSPVLLFGWWNWGYTKGSQISAPIQLPRVSLSFWAYTFAWWIIKREDARDTFINGGKQRRTYQNTDFNVLPSVSVYSLRYSQLSFWFQHVCDFRFWCARVLSSVSVCFPSLTGCLSDSIHRNSLQVWVERKTSSSCYPLHQRRASSHHYPVR